MTTDIDYAIASSRVALMNTARAAVAVRRWTGRPGDGWVVDSLGFPETFGTYGKAVIFASVDGDAYKVTLFNGAGSEVRSQRRKTLDAAFNAGKRLVRKG